MSWYRRGSIKNKLIFIIMSVAVIAVGITTLSISVIGVINLKESMKREIELAANIVGERNKYSIQFGNQAQVSKNLEMFKVRPSVQRSCIYDKKGNVFAFYPIPEDRIGGLLNTDSGFQAASKCPLINDEVLRLTATKLETYKHIRLSNERVGSIYISSDLRAINSYIRNQVITALVVIASVFVMSYILAVRLQKEISQPVLELANAASRVSAYKDYSLRVLSRQSTHDIEGSYPKEVTALVKAFNNMLGDIEEHEQEIERNYKELEKSKEEAESANMAKSQFIASISHELRTPLNAIIGFSTIINSQLFGELDRKYLEYSKDIHDSGVHLLEIINDILDLSKAEAGKLSLQLDEFDVLVAIDKCIRILGERASKGDVEVRTEYMQDMPMIIADRVRFIQIILNILSNAIKFTEKGGVVLVRANNKVDKDGTNKFHIRIEDSGIGMTQEEIAVALQSFGQIDSGLDRKYEGTGLGLPLTKKLVDLHHGTLYIESETRFGTTVHVIIPSQPSEKVKII